MVDAYATTLGGITIAIDEEHLLFEEPLSNSVLTLQPAFRQANQNKITALRKIEGFATGPEALRISWKAQQGISMETSLHLLSPHHFQLRTLVECQPDAPKLAEILPIYISEEGPGACALGMHELRLLGSTKPGRPLQYARAHGPGIYADGLAAFFAPGGSPSLLIAGLKPETGRPLFQINAARGKILSLEMHSPMGPYPAESNRIAFSSVCLVVLGNIPIDESIRFWQKACEEEGLPSLPEVAFDADPPDLQFDLDEEESPAVESVSAFSEDSIPSEEIFQEADPASDSMFPGKGRDGNSGVRSHRRSAIFRRAQRLSEGVWPRWATGRSRPPLGPGSSRTRHNWYFSRLESADD